VKALEVEAHLRSLNGGWVDYSQSVDSWKAGDPEVEVKGIAVAWMSYSWALEKAAEMGCNLFITHEPTFFHHLDNDPAILAWPESRSKRALIEALGLTVLRCHDLWDQYPEIGIPDSWGKKLGLGKPIDGQGFYRVYDGLGRKAIEIARDFAARVSDLGQPGVHLVGSPERPINRIALGTGACTPYFEMLTRYKADLVICADDGLWYWRDAAHAIDNGHNILVFHHHTTEDYGMELLAAHLAAKYPTVPIRFIKQSCMYQLVSPG
jgi:putative NIF3 family GTP cyclohydrolase 1 type 2